MMSYKEDNIVCVSCFYLFILCVCVCNKGTIIHFYDHVFVYKEYILRNNYITRKGNPSLKIFLKAAATLKADNFEK